MRYNAFFGELPLDAFKPIGGKMTLHGGGNPISAVTDAVSNVAGDVVNAVGDVGSSIDKTVRDVVPGGWTTAALLGAGYYFQPELQAFVNSQGATVPASQVADAGALDLGGGITIGADGSIGGGTFNGSGNSFLGAAGGLGASELSNTVKNAAGSSLSSMLPYMAGAQLGTGLLQANSAKEAAQIQADAAAKAQAQQQANFELINKQQAPYRAAGSQSLNQLGSLGTGEYTKYDAAGNPIGTGTGSGYLQHQFDATDLAKGLAPNYDFMLQQGQMANQRAANVGGGSLGGNALQGLNKFTQDYAGNAYQNAFNNYQTQRGNIYNTLAGIAGIGQTGQTATNTAGTNLANAASQLGVGSAAAQAAGTTGATGALANTAGNISNTYLLANLLGQKGTVTP